MLSQAWARASHRPSCDTFQRSVPSKGWHSITQHRSTEGLSSRALTLLSINTEAFSSKCALTLWCCPTTIWIVANLPRQRNIRSLTTVTQSCWRSCHNGVFRTVRPHILQRIVFLQRRVADEGYKQLQRHAPGFNASLLDDPLIIFLVQKWPVTPIWPRRPLRPLRGPASEVSHTAQYFQAK